MVKAPLTPIPTQVALPKVLHLTWLISVLLLICVGGALLFFPAIAQQYWPWTLAPFNTRFLGAIYLSAAIPLLGYILQPRLSLLRIVLPVFACFTTYFLVVSMGHYPSFLARKSSSIWFFLYGADSFIGLFYCWQLRQHLSIPSKGSLTLNLYHIQALLVGLYGLGLLMAASVFGQWWPWPLDPFHSHLYSGVFLSAAMAMVILGDRFSRPIQIIFGGTQFFLGVSTAIGIWIVDSQVHKLVWTSVFPWLWQVIFLGFGLLGGWSLFKAFRTCQR